MSDDTLAVMAGRMGATRERVGIFRLIGSMPVAACHCDPLWLEVGIHFEGCMNRAELAFRVRLLQAIVPIVEERPGLSPLSGVPEPGLSSTTAALNSQVVEGI